MNSLFNKKFLLKKSTKAVIYTLIVLIASIYIIFGNSYYRDKININKGTHNGYSKSEIVEIGESTVDENIGWITTKVKLKLTSGSEKGSVVDAELIQDGMFNKLTREVEVGDKYIAYKQSIDGKEFWALGEPIKSGKMGLLLAIFFIGLIILGGKSGITTIVSLSATCLGIFMVFIPSILAGFNIYINSIVVCIFIILVTLPLVIGLNKKCIAATCGCLGGVLTAGLITVLMTYFMNLSGMVNEESVYITYINSDIDLKAIIFASIIIGSLGATMDVAISIASSMREIANESKEITQRKLILSGMRIGRDIMGTMTNTLILAYIGSSLSVVLLLIAYNSYVFEVLNKEMMTVEILQSLAGSIGMLLTIPITAVISAMLYKKKRTD